MNAPRPSRSTLRSALALAVVAGLAATPGCIGKRRPRDEEKQAAAVATVGARIIQPEDVDGKHDALVEGQRFRAKIDEQDPATGAAIPLVTIVEFSDFQCPYCGKLAETLHDVVGEHGQDVKLVFKQFPLAMHEAAPAAARASLAAQRQGKFWEMHDALFEQPERVGKREFSAIAKEIGLDVAKFERDSEDPSIVAAVERDMEDGRELGIRGTPSIVVGDKLVIGAQPLATLREVVDAELARAR